MQLNIKKIRTELNRLEKPDSWLAEQMGVQRQWVSQMLRNNLSHTFKTIDKIADALGLDPKDLIK